MGKGDKQHPKKNGPAAAVASGIAKRHHKPKRVSTEHLFKSTLRRMMLISGNVMMDKAIFPYYRGLLHRYWQRWMSAAIAYAKHARRKTVTLEDAIHAGQHIGVHLLGSPS